MTQQPQQPPTCDVEVAQLVGVPVLVVCDDAQPVAHVVLLQVLLGQVLEVALGHVALTGHSDLVLVTAHLVIPSCRCCGGEWVGFACGEEGEGGGKGAKGQEERTRGRRQGQTRRATCQQ